MSGGSLAGDPLKLDGYWPRTLAYSVGYGLVMWLLLIGTLGFFQARCAGHSPAWRHLADSLYWIYLVHVPLVAALQVWMAPWPWPARMKFLLLRGGPTASAVASRTLTQIEAGQRPERDRAPAQFALILSRATTAALFGILIWLFLKL